MATGPDGPYFSALEQILQDWKLNLYLKKNMAFISYSSVPENLISQQKF